jgi:Syntaxin 6, N-terminal
VFPVLLLCRLTKDLKSAESHLRDLKRTVEYVEKDRSNFSHIDDNELGDRKAFLNSQKRILNAVKADLESGRLQQKLDRDMVSYCACLHLFVSSSYNSRLRALLAAAVTYYSM